MIKLTTINQIVEALVARGRLFEANIATIILKTAMIHEDKGIYEAMEYYDGEHDGDEYQEFRTEVVAKEEE